MANEFICWDCKGDGTRCDCHKKRGTKRPYEISLADKLIREQLDLREKWRKIGVDYKPPFMRVTPSLLSGK